MFNKNLKQLGEIYITFLKLGCVGFGGGYSMIPLIEREVVEKKKWVEKEKIVDIFAVAGSLPGAIALNASTFVGYTIAGISGAVSALLGNMTPSVIIVLALSVLLGKISSYPEIKAAFTGIYPVIIGMICYAGYKIGKTAIKDITGIILVILTFGISLIFKTDPVPLIISGAVSGVVIKSVRSVHTHGMTCKKPVKKEGEE